MKNYRIVESGVDNFIIQQRTLFFFWIDVSEKGSFTNTLFFKKIEDAELKIIELKKDWSSKNKIIRYY